MRVIAIIGLVLWVYACSKPLQSAATDARCPARVLTWMACPGALARADSACRVLGPELGCGLDRIALEHANRLHASRQQTHENTRFYTFAIEVTQQGAHRAAVDDVPNRPVAVVVDF